MKIFLADKSRTITASATIGPLIPSRSAALRESGSAEAHKNNWRYYADAYYDHSLARVMLANNANYDQTTVIEPQILSSWTSGSITAAVNLGKLPDSGTAYLFVFDANNVHNAAGYPVAISFGAPAVQAPAAPQGLMVR